MTRLSHFLTRLKIGVSVCDQVQSFFDKAKDRSQRV